jgi:G3E family GTPase
MKQKIPVTVLTGFLGAGKTTLLNRILSESHGQRIAVIENEFGEIGIDHGLVINADEEIFEMNNGCICCTVRGDLIRILGQLLKRRGRFDRIVLETTGLANPGPVAQTFFVDEQVSEDFALDGIVTLIDARHIGLHLADSEEAREQVAFADVLVLNKTDLVSEPELAALESRIRAMNGMARVVRAERAQVALTDVVGIGGFDLARALDYKPAFLEPEYPFEWVGAYALLPGEYTLIAQSGPDPAMTIALCQALASEGQDPALAAERAFPWFSGEIPSVNVGERIEVGEAVSRLELDIPGEKRFKIRVHEPALYWLFTEHTAEEFALELRDPAGNVCAPKVSRAFRAGHSHDDAVGSFSLETDQPLDGRRFREWLSRELQMRGADIYRLKGFLNLEGNDERIVLQGVHMLIDNTSLGPWGDRPRRTQLVIIGKNLDYEAMMQGFESCLA